MALLDDIKKGAKELAEKTAETAKDLSNKASDAVESTKINMSISKEEDKIADLKKQLGEIFWKRFEANEDLPDEAKEICNQIKEVMGVIKELQAKIDDIKAEVKEEAPAAEEPKE